MTAGRYFDGTSAQAREVRLSLAATSLAIKDLESGRTTLWPLAEIRLIERRDAQGNVRLGCDAAPDARLGFRDSALLASLEQHGDLSAGHAGRGLVSRRLVLIAVAAMVLFAGALALLPQLAGPLAQVAPPAWRQQLGRQTLEVFAKLGETCTAAAGSRALEQLVGRLAAAADSAESAESFEVRVIDHEMVNAFALPGGHIVFLRGLIDKAGSADEVAGVLAHEMGHVIERHATQSLIRRRGYMVVLDALSLGLASTPGLSDAAVGAGTLLLEFANTREHERAADRAGRRILKRAGISRQGMADFFGRLQAQHGSLKAGSALSYLSTHPPLAERAQAVTKGEARGEASSPALSPQDWQALRAICGD